MGLNNQQIVNRLHCVYHSSEDCWTNVLSSDLWYILPQMFDCLHLLTHCL